MNSDKIQKIFLKNLPSKYSIDKLIALIEDKTNCSPNIGIIKNKKNPNNGLVIITPLSKENEAIIKQNLCDNFYFEQRQILVSEYDKEYKYIKKKNYLQKKKEKKQKQKKNIINNENQRESKFQENENNSQNRHFESSQTHHQKKKDEEEKKKEKNIDQKKKKIITILKMQKNVPKTQKKIEIQYGN
ncbi:RNA recognition motif rrm domain containing protein [Anaeramoeba flamelloides]|uniref:RNA recognition motif rrm domain containing protein n=1 Tax=Anaeramoeba flamelloides TaxID=1746091 RepID=A0AAV8A290_9EUKA|nr:RNA recognition motif rrm domain containing protein [Anaeramoeba flamelloides]